VPLTVIFIESVTPSDNQGCKSGVLYSEYGQMRCDLSSLQLNCGRRDAHYGTAVFSGAARQFDEYPLGGHHRLYLWNSNVFGSMCFSFQTFQSVLISRLEAPIGLYSWPPIWEILVARKMFWGVLGGTRTWGPSILASTIGS
jgi:hypothetical protein